MDIKTIVSRLKEPITQAFMRHKIIQGHKIIFVSWYDTCRLLDDRAGTWSWCIDNIVLSDTRIIISGTLTIYGDDRELSMSATGTEVLNCSNYGDPSSNAEAMAFKRAAAKFGLARYFYDKK